MSELCGPTYNETIGANDVECIDFNNIVDQAIINLASLGVDDVTDLLTIDDKIDGFDVICNILKRAIDEFEYSNPFSIDIYPYLQTGVRYKFVNNFWDFLAGRINRDCLQFVPRAIVSVIGTYLGTQRGVHYEPPYLTNIAYNGQYRVKIIANRPYKMQREGNKFTEDSKYYYIGENTKEILTRFRMLFEIKLCEYVVRLNENLEHPNMPLNTFQGLNNYLSDLKARWDELEDNSFSYYGIYDYQ